MGKQEYPVEQDSEVLGGMCDSVGDTTYSKALVSVTTRSGGGKDVPSVPSVAERYSENLLKTQAIKNPFLATASEAWKEAHKSGGSHQPPDMLHCLTCVLCKKVQRAPKERKRDKLPDFLSVMQYDNKEVEKGYLHILTDVCTTYSFGYHTTRKHTQDLLRAWDNLVEQRDRKAKELGINAPLSLVETDGAYTVLSARLPPEVLSILPAPSHPASVERINGLVEVGRWRKKLDRVPIDYDQIIQEINTRTNCLKMGRTPEELLKVTGNLKDQLLSRFCKPEDWREGRGRRYDPASDKREPRIGDRVAVVRARGGPLSKVKGVPPRVMGTVKHVDGGKLTIEWDEGGTYESPIYHATLLPQYLQPGPCNQVQVARMACGARIGTTGALFKRLRMTKEAVVNESQLTNLLHLGWQKLIADGCLDLTPITPTHPRFIKDSTTISLQAVWELKEASKGAPDLITFPGGERLVARWVARGDMDDHMAFGSVSPQVLVNLTLCHGLTESWVGTGDISNAFGSSDDMEQLGSLGKRVVYVRAPKLLGHQPGTVFRMLKWMQGMAAAGSAFERSLFSRHLLTLLHTTPSPSYPTSVLYHNPDTGDKGQLCAHIDDTVASGPGGRYLRGKIAEKFNQSKVQDSFGPGDDLTFTGKKYARLVDSNNRQFWEVNMQKKIDELQYCNDFETYSTCLLWVPYHGLSEKVCLLICILWESGQRLAI